MKEVLLLVQVVDVYRYEYEVCIYSHLGGTPRKDANLKPD